MPRATFVRFSQAKTTPLLYGSSVVVQKVKVIAFWPCWLLGGPIIHDVIFSSSEMFPWSTVKMPAKKPKHYNWLEENIDLYVRPLKFLPPDINIVIPWFEIMSHAKGMPDLMSYSLCQRYGIVLPADKSCSPCVVVIANWGWIGWSWAVSGAVTFNECNMHSAFLEILLRNFGFESLQPWICALNCFVQRFIVFGNAYLRCWWKESSMKLQLLWQKFVKRPNP